MTDQQSGSTVSPEPPLRNTMLPLSDVPTLIDSALEDATAPSSSPVSTITARPKCHFSDNGLVYHSNLGPEPRGLLAIKSNAAKVAALIPFPPRDDMPAVVFLIGKPRVPNQDTDGILFQQTQDNLEQVVQEHLASLISDPDSRYPDYESMSRHMAAVAPEWSMLLEKTYLAKKGTDRGRLVQRAFHKQGCPVGSSTSIFDMFVSYVQHGGGATVAEAPFSDKAVDMGKTTCLVCFDELPSESLRLRQCGHGICTVCWTAYVQSVATSGHSTDIACPSHKCSGSIGLFDIPHVVFGARATIPMSDAEALYTTLVINEIKRFCIQEKGGRFCTSPSCDKLLLPVASVPMGRGRNILICPCGSISCAECPTGRDNGAHPGISCVKYAGIREEIDSGRADAEYESYRFLLNNSRPCPQCGMSIDRIDGCNHMRCSQCQDYFCWQCGGPGHLCNANSCRNTKNLDYKDTDERRTERDRLAPKVLMFRSYRVAHDRLRQLDQTIRSFERDSPTKMSTLQRLHCMILERQIKQAVLWIRLFLVEQGTDAMLELCLSCAASNLLIRRTASGHGCC
jgi:hypothetical protein